MTFKLSAQPASFSAKKRPSTSLPRPRKSFFARYQILVLGAALAAIFSNLPIYIYILNPGLLPKYFFFGIFVLLAPLVLLKLRSFSAYLASPFVVWAGLFLVLNLVHLTSLSIGGGWGDTYIIDNQNEARQSLIATRIQYILFSILLGFAAYASGHRDYLYPVAVLMVLVPCAVIVDFARPGFFYPLDTEGMVLGRAAATFINPTMAGEAILLVFLMGCAVTSARYRVPLFFLAGAAVIVTFSRSSIIAWVLLLLILSFKRSLPKSALMTALAVFGLGLTLLGSVEAYLQSRQDLEAASSNILSRLDFFFDMKFDDDSSEERADVIRAGWELFLQNPVFGAGAGATQFWSQHASTHNQLLLLAAEYGMFGVGLWIWLLLILWKGTFFAEKGLRAATVFLFIFMTLFTHQMFDSATYWLASFALISLRKIEAFDHRP